MRVLMAYAGGEAGEKALAAIAPWARESGAEVHLVRVLNPKDIHETGYAAGGSHTPAPAGTVTDLLLGSKEPKAHLAEDRSQAFVAARGVAQEQLHEVGKRVFGIPDIAVHVEVAEDVADAIVAAALKVGAAVIAVGTHGRTGLQHALLGSVAEAVVRRSTVPVLVVGPHVG